MKYWLNLGGEKTYGPYEVDRLRIFQSEGKLGASAQLCQEGGMQWVPAASVLGPTNTVAPPPLRQSTVSAPLGVQVGGSRRIRTGTIWETCRHDYYRRSYSLYWELVDRQGGVRVCRQCAWFLGTG